MLLSKCRSIRTIALVAGLGAFIALLALVVGCASRALTFNEIDSLYAAAPKYYPDGASAEISANEANDILGIDIPRCIPGSLKDYWVYASKSYFIPDELRCIDISIQDKAHEPGFGKVIVLSIASKEWSERSTLSVDYAYDGTTYKSSSAYGVSIDAYMRPPIVDENVETGYYSEESAVFIAKFQIDGLEYYVEGREGITQDEFSEFVINIVRNYKG